MATIRLLTISRRLLFATCITHAPPLSRPLMAHASRLQRCTFADSAALEIPTKSPLGVASIYGDWGLTVRANMFAGMDYEHWVVHMNEPGGEGATKEQMIDCYIKTLAKVVGSEEEAKKYIYKVVCDPKFHLQFGCQLDWETAYKIQDLPEVKYISADYYRGPKDYVGKHCELLVNGKIVNEKGGATCFDL